MLQFLKVENLALIDSVEMECHPGFTAVTGETGAGKSVIMGALSLLSGRRADRSMIRKGAEFCEVQASLFFREPSRVNAAMQEAGLQPMEDGELVLHRKIQAAGGQRILVNGQVAALGQLAALGDVWLELHGPEAPLALFHRAAQVDLLDAFAGNGALRETFSDIFHQWSQLKAKIERIENEGSLSEDEQTYLQSQIEEIRMLNISQEWLEKLESDFHRVSNAREIDQRLSGLEDALSGPKGAPGRLADVYRCGNKLRELVPDEVGPHMDRLDALMVDLNDLFGELEALRSVLEVDGYEIEEVENNMKLWMGVRRRHGGSVEAVLEKCEEMEERLASQGNIEGTLAKLGKEEKALRDQLESVGAQLTEKREKISGPLAKKVTELLTRLGFKKPAFRIEVEPVSTWTERGTSSCEYLFSGTAGQAAMPLGKVASSGEIARVTLALKTVLAAVDHTAVLVFDEIDANVGGEVGREIGRELSRLAEDNQVFTITHLPQVAAMASSHFVVTKDQSDDSAAVSLRPLSEDRGERIDEIARMLGDRKSKTARSHAEELLGS
ncbi:DNA repair protein RecN [Puniceicoccus vermicola]|uniref:DNA repair protein RecN n=1 Tax=Puniceicoccus vermicola TaxID=388746 RepID=A0A7X1AW05_9BACT|nr:DNA repair protein RecN [Puniceicoccus vermicola]MBC2601030.1 DNA repair protein RecN [Puniceicoccus vermicola]